MLYILEIKSETKTSKAVRFLEIETGAEQELFRDRTLKAPEPFQDTDLLVGSKPPVLSGNGQVAAFCLSLDQPASILDHYMAVINTDGTNLRIFSLPIEALKGKDSEKLKFQTAEWERVSNYALNDDGCFAACAVKGHLGPIRYGNASGIILLNTSSSKQKTIIAPDFNGQEWVWTSPPFRPLTGGGWAFAISGSGQRILFGAQSSENRTDYDLYITDREGKEKKRITDFHDRWFSQADLDQQGKHVVFYYTGKKKMGIGSYLVKTDGSGLRYLRSKAAPRIEFFDMSSNGRYILFKHVYAGILMDLHTGLERIAFDENAKGYVHGLVPMDFPRFPSFWAPKIMSQSGKYALAVVPPPGKDTPEIYLLHFESEK
jgi:hypothetical protein